MMIETDDEKILTIKTITVQALLHYSFLSRLKKAFTVKKVYPNYYSIKAINKDKEFWNFHKNKFGPWSNDCLKKIKALNFGDWLIFFWKLEDAGEKNEEQNIIS